MSCLCVPPRCHLLLCAAFAVCAVPAHGQKLAVFPRYTEHAPAVPVYRVATGGVLHRFFDTSPFSPSGRYLALFRLPWDRTGRWVAFNGLVGDTRNVFVADLSAVLGK